MVFAGKMITAGVSVGFAQMINPARATRYAAAFEEQESG
jgi:hypothetical protein